MADSNRFGMCQYSKYKFKFERYTNPYLNADEFIKDISRIIKKYDIELIFPSHNETEILSKYKHMFVSDIVRLIPEYKKIKFLNNKKLASRYSKMIGINIPRKIFYNNLNDLNRKLIDNKKNNRYVVKTLRGNGSKGVFHCYTKKQTIKQVKKLIKSFNLKNNLPIVEEYVSGIGCGCSFFYDNGKCIAYFPHKRLREKIVTGGPSTYREFFPNQELIQFSKKILDQIKWNGFAMCEFKFCSESQKLYFIEVNPRLWGSLPFAINFGVDFPNIAVSKNRKNFNLNSCIKNDFGKSNRGRWLLGDLFLAFSFLIKLNFYKFLIILFSKNHKTDDFYFDDIWAFIGQIFYYLHKVFKYKSINPIEKGMIE